ncbi:MAG: hypothetical protein ABI867_16725 [Kofleriaceae bacterium]
MSRERSEPPKRAGKRSRSAESRRRVATYLQQLAWLEGFPDAEGWRRLDTNAVIVVDGTLVARSRRAARTAMREHTEALAGVVGDVERWWSTVDAVLAWCSTRRGVLDLIDRAPAKVVRVARGVRRDLAIAAGIGFALVPDQLGHAIDWFAAHAPAIAELDVATALQLARLARIDKRGVAALVELLAVDAPDPQQAVEVVANLKKRLGKPGAFAPAPVRSTKHVATWLAELAKCDRDVQQRRLALLAEARPAAAIAVWAEWERMHAAKVARTRTFAERDFDRREEADNLERINAAIELVRTSAPTAIAIDEVLPAIDQLAREHLRPYHTAAVRLLAALPDVPLARARMQIHLTRAATIADAGDLRPAWLWDEVASYLERGGHEALVRPWFERLATHDWAYVEDDMLEHVKGRAAVKRLVDVLARMARQSSLAGDLATRAGAWIGAGLDPETTAEVLERMRAVEGDLRLDIARAARAIADGTSADLAVQATALLGVAIDLDWVDARELMKLIIAVGGDAAWLVRSAVANRQGARLANAGWLAALLPRTQRPALVTAARAAWIARYPEMLAVALGHLAAVDPEAEATARKRLATDLPDPAELRRELGVLRGKPPAPATTKRIANLEARLVAPKLPSPARLARLAGKLEHTATTIGIERFVAAASERAYARVVQTFALPATPAWPLDRKTQQTLFGLLTLDARERELAGRLLRARLGPAPWDLRDDPVNRAYLDKLRKRGIDPDPWLDDLPRTVSVGQEVIELALCGDPLEVFAMGAHFQTCLSPGKSNFFSVIANAADVNKRVLYARRNASIIGRCLLAITDSNGLLAFHPYCHANLDFATIVRDYMADLATRMGTTVVPRGSVAMLLARDWYDDGPRDLAGRFRELEQLRDEIETIAPAALVARLRAKLSHDLDEITLPLVLELVRDRPALVVELVPQLLASTTPATRIAAAELAMAANQPELARRLFGDHGDAVRLEHHAWPSGEILAQLRPSFALARLRATRVVRRLADEPGDRLAVAGAALEALHRPRQAAALYRLALEREDHLAYYLNPRLARLGFAVE